VVKQCSFANVIELAGSPKDAALPALDSIQENSSINRASPLGIWLFLFLYQG
jgi:hypothetical protein